MPSPFGTAPQPRLEVVVYPVVRAAADRRITDLAFRMYVLLYTQLDTVQFRAVKRTWFMGRLGHHQPRNVERPRMSGALARALRQLVEFGYIERGGLIGDRGRQVMSYRLVLSLDPPAPPYEGHKG